MPPIEPTGDESLTLQQSAVPGALSGRGSPFPRLPLSRSSAQSPLKGTSQRQEQQRASAPPSEGCECTAQPVLREWNPDTVREGRLGEERVSDNI